MFTLWGFKNQVGLDFHSRSVVENSGNQVYLSSSHLALRDFVSLLLRYKEDWVGQKVARCPHLPVAEGFPGTRAFSFENGHILKEQF